MIYVLLLGIGALVAINALGHKPTITEKGLVKKAMLSPRGTNTCIVIMSDLSRGIQPHVYGSFDSQEQGRMVISEASPGIYSCYSLVTGELLWTTSK